MENKKRQRLNPRKRIRAHSNPLSDNLDNFPLSPDKVDWAAHYPAFFKPGTAPPEVTIADIGCGFGGLLVGLSPLFPDKLLIGIEIRRKVVESDEKRILALRSGMSVAAFNENRGSDDDDDQEEEEEEPCVKPEEVVVESSAAAAAADQVQAPVDSVLFGSECSAMPPFSNISVLCSNIMKYAPNYFRKGQLEKMFFCFPDPHFKRTNFRRRIINSNFLSIYAYCLRPGGRLYTISDVLELSEWMVEHLTKHPLFRRLTDEELAKDPCVPIMATATEESKKVERLRGNKYPAVFVRI